MLPTRWGSKLHANRPNRFTSSLWNHLCHWFCSTHSIDLHISAIHVKSSTLTKWWKGSKFYFWHLVASSCESLTQFNRGKESIAPCDDDGEKNEEKPENTTPATISSRYKFSSNIHEASSVFPYYFFWQSPIVCAHARCGAFLLIIPHSFVQLVKEGRIV